MAWYAIATYENDAAKRPAIVLGDDLYDLAQLAAASASAGLAVSLPSDLGDVIRNWEAHANSIKNLAERAPSLIAQNVVSALPKSSYRLALPFVPGRIFATASNFYEHAAEMGTELAPRSESSPYCFMKAETSVTATGTDVVMPNGTEKLDWEVELGVVIGRKCKDVSTEEAYSYIAGYTVFNDISARDLNRRSDYPFKHDWFRGKSFDTFGPMGPWMVPRECISDPQQLRMQLSVNGEMMQDDTAEGMIFNIAEQIAYLSGILTLLPGDLLATGTPTGVGMGRGIYLKPGDQMIATIENIGSIHNRVISSVK